MSTKTKKTREELAKEFCLDAQKKWILFAECRDSVWTFDEKDIQETVILGCDRNDIIESMEENKKGILSMIEDFDKLNDSFFERYEVIYRPHPGTICPIPINKRIKVNSNYSIYEWLNNIDYYLTSTSTSIFEAESLNVPCFICEREDWPSKFLIYGLEKYDKMNSILDFEEFIKTHSGIYDEIYKDYIGTIDGGNIDRVVNAMKDIITKYTKFNMVKVHVPLKTRMRKRLYEKITRISCKSKLILKIKYPRSAYRERNDIPYFNDNLNKFSNN